MKFQCVLLTILFLRNCAKRIQSSTKEIDIGLHYHSRAEPSCTDIKGAVERDSVSYPSCKCMGQNYAVFCQDSQVAGRKFDATSVLANPSCVRPECKPELSCEAIPGAKDRNSEPYPNCKCAAFSHSIYCADEKVAGRKFDATVVRAHRKCSNFKPRCSSEPTCEQIDGAIARKTEKYPLCKCVEGYHSLQCGRQIVAGRKFNASQVFSSPDCAFPRCVITGRDCTYNTNYDPEQKYIDELKQGMANDSVLVQMASISNRINDLATPVAGWKLVKSWKLGAEGNCIYVHNVGIYQREGRCVLSFSSSQALNDFSEDEQESTRTWCGFTEVQGVYARGLDIFMNGHRFQEFVDFLKGDGNCPGGILGAGHSMGGALISLMSLCANQNRSLFAIDELYTFGVPGVSLHQLNNSLSTDGCFKGSRVYNMDTDFVDPIPEMSGNFKHPKLQEIRIKQMSDGSYVTKQHECDSSHARDYPSSAKTFEDKANNMTLHEATVYIRRLLLLSRNSAKEGDQSENKIHGSSAKRFANVTWQALVGTMVAILLIQF